MELKIEFYLLIDCEDHKINCTKKYEADYSELEYLINDYQLKNFIPSTGDYLQTINGNAYLVRNRLISIEKIVMELQLKSN